MSSDYWNPLYRFTFLHTETHEAIIYATCFLSFKQLAFYLYYKSRTGLSQGLKINPLLKIADKINPLHSVQHFVHCPFSNEINYIPTSQEFGAL